MGKGGTRNLIPASQRSKDEVREIGRKGGLKSGETRRRQKLIRETINEIMPLTVADPALRQALIDAGLEPSYEVAMSYAVLSRAAKGDVEAARFIRDTRGEKPVEGLALGQFMDKPIQAIDLSTLTDDELMALAARYEEPENLPPAR